MIVITADTNSPYLVHFSQSVKGREMICQRSQALLPKICDQFQSRNVLRRKSAIGTVRNCLFDSDEHFYLVVEKNILTAILLPLVVNTPFTEEEKKGMDAKIWMAATLPDRKAEDDEDCLLMLLESLLMLCQRRLIREELRRRQAYPVIRNFNYKQEKTEKFDEIILNIVNFLKRDDISLEDAEKEREELEEELRYTGPLAAKYRG